MDNRRLLLGKEMARRWGIHFFNDFFKTIITRRLKCKKKLRIFKCLCWLSNYHFGGYDCWDLNITLMTKVGAWKRKWIWGETKLSWNSNTFSQVWKHARKQVSTLQMNFHFGSWKSHGVLNLQTKLNIFKQNWKAMKSR